MLPCLFQILTERMLWEYYVKTEIHAYGIDVVDYVVQKWDSEINKWRIDLKSKSQKMQQAHEFWLLCNLDTMKAKVNWATCLI